MENFKKIGTMALVALVTIMAYNYVAPKLAKKPAVKA